MNSAEHYTTRYLETDDLDQYNALLRYTFQVTEEELTATAVQIPGAGTRRCAGLF